MDFSRFWLFATVPLFALGVTGVVWLAMNLIRFTREAIVASLPVVSEQRVVLPTDNHYSILMQGQIGGRGLGDLRFAVVAEQSAQELRVSPVLMRTRATTLDGTVRLELFSFSALAGRHIIRVIGIDPARDYGQNRVVIARSGRGQLVARIVALVFTSMLTVASLVASALLIAGQR
jgi:hypothetical protein